MTRIEHIRTMSVEEMAESIIERNITDDYCTSDCGFDECECDHALECCIAWLESEPKAGIIDSKAMKMHMAGISDVKIARAFGVSPVMVFHWRTERGLPNNRGLFAWQKTYDGFIPEKYRKPKE